jgi:hypothetical protein
MIAHILKLSPRPVLFVLGLLGLGSSGSALLAGRFSLMMDVASGLKCLSEGPAYEP